MVCPRGQFPRSERQLDARRSVTDTATLPVSTGQITVKPEPNAVLDVLVSSHVLMRAGDTSGISFQHQQFQEWYAPHSVERRILAEVHDPKGRESFKVEVLNFPSWEEAVLFAVERMSRGEEHQLAACGKAILAAFEVDPILAAETMGQFRKLPLPEASRGSADAVRPPTARRPSCGSTLP